MSAVHPSSAKVFEFVERLEAAIGRYPGVECDMMYTEIEPECGTPGCHAGWAFVAIRPEENVSLGFLKGVVELNNFFGFERFSGRMLGVSGLELWAKDNPEIWGNEFGDQMFSEQQALGQLEQWFPPQAIVNHWRSVGERLRALEEAQS